MLFKCENAFDVDQVIAYVRLWFISHFQYFPGRNMHRNGFSMCCYSRRISFTLQVKDYRISGGSRIYKRRPRRRRRRRRGSGVWGAIFFRFWISKWQL